MTNNIIVFQPPETKDVSISKTEKEILYKKFEEQASIPTYHFQTFMEMDDKANKAEVKTTIPSIMIKDILLYCTPIIKELPDFNIQTKTVDIFKKKEVIEKTESYYNIAIQLDRPIECYVNDMKLLKTIIIPSNTMFFIIGLIIPHQFQKYIDSTIPNFINSLSIDELLSSGKYGLIEFQSDTYTQSHIPKLSPTTSKQEILNSISTTKDRKDFESKSFKEHKDFDSSQNVVYFSSDDNSREKITAIVKYIKYLNLFYEKNFYMVNQYLSHPPFATYIKKYIQEFNIMDYASIIKQPTPTLTLKLMEQLIHSKTGSSAYANNFLFTTFAIFHIYNKINILGLNHTQSKKVIQILDNQNKYDKILSEYNQLKFRKKLEYAKKKAISIDKFQISNLMKLTDAQKKIVDIQYDKLEKYYSAFQKHTEDFKIINRLYWAITNDKQKLIKDLLKDIEKLVNVPKNLDKATEMLQNKHKINLICPHEIARAQKMIATDYKTDLIKSGQIRKYLIQIFSLPPTNEGYFCKICGERLQLCDNRCPSCRISLQRLQPVYGR